MATPNGETTLNLMEIENKNFNTSLELFDIVRHNVEEYYSFINKYKEYTAAYYDKLSKLTYNITKENITTNKNINISPIISVLNKISKIIKLQINGMKKFIDSLDLAIKPLDNVLKQNIDKLEEPKKHFEENKKKYTKNMNKHKKLMDTFSQTEKRLIKYYLTKKKQNDYTEERNNMISFLKETKHAENEYLETTNGGQNFHQIFQEDSLNNIDEIKSHIRTIFENINVSIIFFICMFYDCYNPPTELAKTEKEQIDSKPIDVNQLINDSMILKTFSLEELPSDKYTIKILNNPKINQLTYSFSAKNEITPKFDFSNIINFFIKNDEINEDEIFSTLNKIDLLGIAKKMYSNYKKVSDKGYNLKIEEEKFNVKRYTDRLLLMKLRKKMINKDNEIKITNEEKNKLFEMVKKKENGEIFLTRLNKIRIYGNFEYSKQIFDDISKIFVIILDNIDPVEDTFLVQFIMILSQTFYRLEKGEKEYLYKSIRNHKHFHLEETWRKLLDDSINEKSQQYQESEYTISSENEDEEKKKKKITEITFAQIIATIHNMIDFEFELNSINKIKDDYIKKYNLTEDQKLAITEMIKAKIQQ
jgi:hypothetical protein